MNSCSFSIKSQPAVPFCFSKNSFPLAKGEAVSVDSFSSARAEVGKAPADHYMDFIPRVQRFFTQLCSKVMNIWLSFVQKMKATWHWLIGYNPQKPVVGTPQAQNVVEQSMKYRHLTGVSGAELVSVVNHRANKPDNSTIDLPTLTDRVFDELVPSPEKRPKTTFLEQACLVTSAMTTQNVFFLAASSIMIQGLQDSKKLSSAQFVASDLVGAGVVSSLLGKISGPLAPAVSTLCGMYMIATLATGHLTDKSLSTHIACEFYKRIAASRVDCEKLSQEVMPHSATNEQRMALESIQSGKGTVWDVRCALKGLTADNYVLVKGRQLNDIKRAADTHNFVGAASLAGMTAVICTSIAGNNLVTLAIFPGMVGALRWYVPEIAGLQNKVVRNLHDLVTDSGFDPFIEQSKPAFHQGLVASNAALVAENCVTAVLPSNISVPLAPVISGAIVLLPTQKQQKLLVDQKYLEVATAVGFSLPARVATFAVATSLLGNGNMGILAASVATNVAAETFLENAHEKDKNQPVVQQAQAGLGALASGVFAMNQVCSSGLVSNAVAVFPVVSAVIPTADQIETFTTASRAEGVAQWAITSAVSGFVGGGVWYASETFLGSDVASMLAMGTVSVLKPYVDGYAKQGAKVLVQKGTELSDRMFSVNA